MNGKFDASESDIVDNELGETGRGADAALVAGRNLLPDPGLVWQIFRRNLMLFVAIVAVVLGLAAVWLATRTPRYETTASLLLQPAPQALRTGVDTTRPADLDSDTVDTEIRLLSSPVLARRAAAAYAARNPSPTGGEWTEREKNALANRMAEAIKITRAGSTSVIDLAATSTDPNFAAATANFFAEEYVQSQIDAKSGRNAQTNQFLRARLSELERNALSTQAAVDNYKIQHGLLSANGATMAEQEVSTLNQQLAQAQADLAEKRGRLAAARAQLSRGGGGADVGAALGSNTIGNLRAQETTTSAQLAQLTQRYGPLFPERRQVESQLADIHKQIQQEINRILSSLEADVATAQSRAASLSGSRGSASGDLVVNGRAQAGLNELLQRAEAAKTIYESFLNRSRETGALAGTQQPDAQIAARASVPEEASFPNYKLSILFAFVVSIVLGVFGIGVAEYLRRGVQTRRDVERRLRLRYAGAVPTLKSTIGRLRVTELPHDYVVSHPHSLFAESFRSIRTFLTLSAGARPRAIAVTSALPQEGKTTTAVCLARATALEGVRTVIVDADLRRRGASELLRFPQQPDLYSYLDKKVPLREAIYVDEASGLHVLGTSEPQRDARNPLTEIRVTEMLVELREQYDVIILDTAPVLGVAETRVLATLADRVLLLTRWRRTSSRAIEAVADMLVDAGAKITGVALTQVDITRYASTGDGDVYGYTKKFRGYYTN